jgi:tRNA U54 and U55 pseudouridine synthase Pus10
MAEERKCELCRNRFKKDETFLHPFEKERFLGKHYLCSLCLDKVYSENGYYVHITDRGDRLYLDKNDDGNIVYYKNCTTSFPTAIYPILNASGEIDLNKTMHGKEIMGELSRLTMLFNNMMRNEAYQVYKEVMRKLGKEVEKKFSELNYIGRNGKRDERAIVITKIESQEGFDEKK